MHRASNTFSVLQVTAAVVALAIVLWSLGLSSIRFAEAANVTSFSDTLSTSEPSVVSDHTITFTTPTGVAAGQTIVITFPDGASDFDLSTIGAEDIDFASTSDYALSNSGPSGETWGVSTSTFSITLTSGTAVISSNATVTIEIGSHALFGGGSQTQIVNPAAGSYEINVAAGASDSGSTRVAIVPVVTVTASVDTLFQFTVTGVAGDQTVNGTSTGGTTTATLIPFGKLESGSASTAAQDLQVVTNAKNGFVVTVTADGMLRSATGADIDGFRNGNYDATAIAWEAPTLSVGSEWTYGHWGITSNDSDYFASGEYVSASTTPVEVFTYGGPTNGTGAGDGITRVGYTVQITPLQEAAEDYQAALTYVATPVF
jgi:hypothetical protein